MKKLTIMDGGKSKNNLRTSKEIDISKPREATLASVDHIQTYLEDYLTPYLFDMNRQLEEMDRKYDKLLKLLARHLKD